MEVNNNQKSEVIKISYLEKKLDSEIINKDVIAIFKRVFNSKEQYFKHLSVIWTLRDLVGSRLYSGISHENPDYIMFNTLSEITSALIANNECFAEFNLKFRV